jgi:hypothetical protein
MSVYSDINTPNTPTGAAVYELLGHEIVGGIRSTRRFPRAAVLASFMELQGGGGVAFASKAQANAHLDFDEFQMAFVWADSEDDNGVYQKIGASGSGSWTRIGDLPVEIVRMVVTGGTADAIVASMSPQVPLNPVDKLYVLIPSANNAGPVTLNGAKIKNNLGSTLVENSLITGVPVMMIWDTDHYQLMVSLPVDTAGVVADATAARDAAEDFRDEAENYKNAAETSAAALGNQVHQYDTLAQAAAATIPVGVQTIKVTRFAAGHPLSYATYIPGTSSGPLAFQEAGGHYWELDLSGGVIDVHWFGAFPSPLGAAPASVVDSTAAIQAPITYLAARGGGTIQFGRGVYGIESLAIGSNNIRLRGAGANATTLMHICSTPSSALLFDAGAGILSNCGVSDLAIGSANTTTNKIAINARDVSEFVVDNVSIAHYPVDGSLYRASGSTATGLLTQGRELGKVKNFQCYADRPINIAVNPHAATLSIDSWTFADLILYAGASTVNSCITIDAGVVLTNVSFTGHENWMGGKNGLIWSGAASAISSGLYVEGLKSEQAGDVHGYAILINNTGTLHSLSIKNAMMGDRNGINVKNCGSLEVTNVFYDHGTAAAIGSDGFGLVVDGTVRQMFINSSTWTSGTLGSIAGLTVRGTAIFTTGYSTQVPSQGVYTV